MAVENDLRRCRRSGIEFDAFFPFFSALGIGSSSVVAAATVGLRLAVLPFLPACWAVAVLACSLLSWPARRAGRLHRVSDPGQRDYSQAWNILE